MIGGNRTQQAKHQCGSSTKSKTDMKTYFNNIVKTKAYRFRLVSYWFCDHPISSCHHTKSLFKWWGRLLRPLVVHPVVCSGTEHSLQFVQTRILKFRGFRRCDALECSGDWAAAPLKVLLPRAEVQLFLEVLNIMIFHAWSSSIWLIQ